MPRREARAGHDVHADHQRPPLDERRVPHGRRHRPAPSPSFTNVACDTSTRPTCSACAQGPGGPAGGDPGLAPGWGGGAGGSTVGGSTGSPPSMRGPASGGRDGEPPLPAEVPPLPPPDSPLPLPLPPRPAVAPHPPRPAAARARDPPGPTPLAGNRRCALGRHVAAAAGARQQNESYPDQVVSRQHGELLPENQVAADAGTSRPAAVSHPGVSMRWICAPRACNRVSMRS